MLPAPLACPQTGVSYGHIHSWCAARPASIAGLPSFFCTRTMGRSPSPPSPWLRLGIALVAWHATATAIPFNPPPRGGPAASRSFPRAAERTDGQPLPVSLWPLPRSLVTGPPAAVVVLSPAFAFTSTGPGGDASALLSRAFARYSSIILGGLPGTPAAASLFDGPLAPSILSTLTVMCATNSTALGLATNESYALTVRTDGTADLHCETVFGCIRGLETFSQLVVRWPTPSDLVIPGVPIDIHDAPRFPHRGLMIDTSRHLLPVATILSVIDGLSYDKLNVLHWHLTDAQSFPFSSTFSPSLANGAWSPLATYSRTQISSVVQYGRDRGVAVVMELDTPAHVESWGVGRPDVMINCSSNAYLSLLDPTLNATYDLVEGVVRELASLAPDARFHAGVDEVDFVCLNSTRVNAWMAAQGISVGDYKAVVRYYITRLQRILLSASLTPMYWQEVSASIVMTRGVTRNSTGLHAFKLKRMRCCVVM